MTILSTKGAELNSMKLESDRGFNYADYDLTITEKGKELLMKENSKININKAQNGKYYLPAGTYTVQVGGAKTELNVKGR